MKHLILIALLATVVYGTSHVIGTDGRQAVGSFFKKHMLFIVLLIVALAVLLLTGYYFPAFKFI